MKRFILYISILFLGLANVNYAQTTSISLPDTIVTVGPATLNIPMMVQNFNNVGAISMKVSYNPAILTFEGIENSAVAGITANAASGEIAIGWFSPDGVTPVNISNGKLLDLKFAYTNGSSQLDFISAQSEITTVDGDEISVNYENGNVSSPVRVSLVHIQATPGDTVKVPLNALNLINIGAVSLDIAYNASVLEYLGVESDAVGFTPNASGGHLSLAWFSSDNTPLNITSGAMAELVFRYVDGSSPLEFNTSMTEIAALDGDVINVAYINGSVAKERSVNLPSLKSAINTSVSFPLTVTNLSVGSASFDVTFDPAVLSYDHIANSVGDGADANVISSGRLRIAYFNAVPGFSNGKLFDIVFNYIAGSTVLDFDETQSSMTDELGADYIGFQFNNGSIEQINAPVFTTQLSDTTIAENQLITFQYSASDLDSDSLIYSLVDPPAGAVITSEGNFSWTPDYTQSGNHSIVVRVTDGIFTVNTAAAVITVTNVNLSPAFTSVMPDTTIPEGAEFTFQYEANDPDTGTVLVYTLVESPVGSSISASGLFSWTPGFEQEGSHNVKVVVSDGDLSDTTETSVIVVSNVNRAPAFTSVMPDTTIPEGAEFTFQYEANDPDTGTVLVYTLVESPVGSAISASGLFSWTPGFDQSGTHNVKVAVSDGDLSDTTETTLIVVTDLNRLPTFTSVIGFVTIKEQDTLTFTYAATDLDGDTLTYSRISSPAGSTFDAATRIFRWIPSYTQGVATAYSVIIGVTDGKGTVVRDTSKIKVDNVNRPPSITEAFDTHGMEQGDTLIFQYRGTDPDGTVGLVWGINPPVANAQMNSSNGRLRFIPASTGTFILNVYLTDKIDTVYHTSTVTVVVGVDSEPGIPDKYSLSQNYPNPFNPATKIKFGVPQESFVSLKIFNLLGEEVATVVNETLSAGNYRYDFNASSLTSGIYIYRIQAGDFISTKKMTLIK